MAELVLFHIDDAPVAAGPAILGAPVVLALGISWVVGVLLRRHLLPKLRLVELTQAIFLRVVCYGIVLAGLLTGLAIICILVGSLQRLWNEVPLFTGLNAKSTLSTMAVAATAVPACTLVSRWVRPLL